MKNMQERIGTIETPAIYTKTTVINAPASKIWEALTKPDLMKQWMNAPELVIDVDWRQGGTIILSGVASRVPYTNKGMVLDFLSPTLLRYTHLSSLSRLADVPESYTSLSFELAEKTSAMELIFTASNFPTASIYHHFAYYWNITLVLLKKFVEDN